MLSRYDGSGRVILAASETDAREFVADHIEYRRAKYIGSRAAVLSVKPTQVIVTPKATKHRLHAELLHECMKRGEPTVKVTAYEDLRGR